MSIPSIVYKAHATGNDFVVYLDEDGTHEPTADEVRFLCDRHFGIGGDGLIRLAHPQAVSDVNERQIADCRSNFPVKTTVNPESAASAATFSPR